MWEVREDVVKDRKGNALVIFWRIETSSNKRNFTSLSEQDARWLVEVLNVHNDKGK
jgi:hypothetical protein